MPSGRIGLIRSSSFFTSLATWTVLLPDCFPTEIPTAGFPSYLAVLVLSLIVSWGFPTCQK